MAFNKTHEKLEKDAVKKAFPSKFGNFKKEEAAEQKAAKKLPNKGSKR